jgi:putative Mn2+ efflux pump MntP
VKWNCLKSATMTLFLDAFLLALASSTDNFMVGMTVGISNQSLSFGVNALISICNATGALLASFGGSALGQSLPPHLPPLLSAIAFGGLALREFFEFWQTIRRKRHLLLLKKKETCQSDENIHRTIGKHEDEDVANPVGINSTGSGKKFNTSRAMHLAIPMTLNNLAGGVAGTYSYAQMNIHAYNCRI